jgi:hypothetical protein
MDDVARRAMLAVTCSRGESELVLDGDLEDGVVRDTVRPPSAKVRRSPSGRLVRAWRLASLIG